MKRHWIALIGIVVLSACKADKATRVATDSGVEEPATVDGNWTMSDLNGACSTEDRIGGFELVHWDNPGDLFSTATGTVSNGTIPNTILEPRETDGDCQLLTRNNPFCDPPCESGQTCDHDGTCITYPAQQNIGTVTVAGLNQALTLEPDTYNNYWDTAVQYPMYDPNALVEIKTSGSDIDGFTLRGVGVEQLVLSSLNWQLVAGEDLTISWTAGATDARIIISLNIDQHGNSPVTMVCDTEDDGEEAVPAALVDILINYGVTGFATGTIRRRSADRVDLDAGCAELLVYSHINAQLSVSGHTPCTSDADCEDGQECDMATQTCVDSD